MKRVLCILFGIAAGLYAQKLDSPAERDPLISEARANALNYAKQLPDLRARQISNREHDEIAAAWNERSPIVAGKKAPHMKGTNIINESFSLSGGHENYSDVKIDGVRVVFPTHGQLHGTVSISTYAWFLSQIFDPEAHTMFRWERADKSHGRSTAVFAFEIPRPRPLVVFDSSPLIHSEVSLTYRGSVHIDAESSFAFRRI